MAWHCNRQPPNRSAHPRGYAGGHVQVRQLLAGDLTPGADLFETEYLSVVLEAAAALEPQHHQRRPLSPAFNRSPFNRSAHLRRYVAGRLWIRGALEGCSKIGANVAGPVEKVSPIRDGLFGAASLDQKILEQRPLSPAYNRQPFNRSARRSGYAALTMHIGAELKAAVIPSANAFAIHRAASRLNSRGQMTQGLEIKLPVESVLLGGVDAITGVQAGMHPKTHLLGQANLGANAVDTQDWSALLSGRASTAAYIYHKGGPVVFLGGAAHAGAEVYAVPRLYEVLVGYAGAYNIDELVTAITGAIPPGGVLTIDAENFNVLLDNVEVIHRHQGAWLSVGRGTVSFTLASVGSTDYHWEVFYHARYL